MLSLECFIHIRESVGVVDVYQPGGVGVIGGEKVPLAPGPVGDVLCYITYNYKQNSALCCSLPVGSYLEEILLS